MTYSISKYSESGGYPPDMLSRLCKTCPTVAQCSCHTSLLKPKKKQNSLWIKI